MTLLILGLLLWTAAHFFKRMAPAARASMDEKMGSGAKGAIAVLLVVSIVLMVIGYKNADGAFYWGRSPAMVGINNLLMLLSVGLFGVNSSKSRLRGKVRHGMLSGVLVWSVAHILVNGDVPSLVLFGGLAAWSVAEMIVLNRTTEPDPPYQGSLAGDIRLLIITLVVYAVISVVHLWLGYSPFG